MPSKKDPAGPTALPLPLNLERWYLNTPNVQRLRELMSHPVMGEALSLLLEHARPTQSVTSGTPDQNSTMLGWYAGYCDALSDLRSKLTDPTMPDKLKSHQDRKLMSRELEDEDPWSHISTPSADYAFAPMPSEE